MRTFLRCLLYYTSKRLFSTSHFNELVVTLMMVVNVQFEKSTQSFSSSALASSYQHHDKYNAAASSSDLSYYHSYRIIVLIISILPILCFRSRRLLLNECCSYPNHLRHGVIRPISTIELLLPCSSYFYIIQRKSLKKQFPRDAQKYI